MVRYLPPDAASDAPLDLAECERRIDYVFRDKLLLRAALTHASGAVHRLGSNEPLAFLGEASMGAVVCRIPFHQYPTNLEGDLTQITSDGASRTHRTNIAE